MFFHSCLNIRCHNHHIRTKLGTSHDCVISRFVTRGTMRPSHFQNRDGVWSHLSTNGCCKRYIWVTRKSLSVSLLVSLSHGKTPLVLHEPAESLSTSIPHPEALVQPQTLRVSGSRLVQSPEVSHVLWLVPLWLAVICRKTTDLLVPLFTQRPCSASYNCLPQ